MAAVQGHEPLAGDEAEPEEGGNPWVRSVLGGAANDSRVVPFEVFGEDVGIKQSFMPRLNVAATKPAMSQMASPPTAMTRSSL